MRELERQVGAVCRATAVKLADGHDVQEVATPDHIEDRLGPHKYRAETIEKSLRPGVATGLAATPAGGRLMFVEASKMPGKGRVNLTGNMRNIMKEAAMTAVSFVRSKADKLHLDPEWIKDIDLHLHVPQHGVPKDGPAAGMPMFAAVASLMLDCPIRADVAMVGEISLRGRVLEVGDVIPKLLAAHRAGIKEVLMPARNRVDLQDAPDELLDEIEVRLVETVDEVLPLVLAPPEEKVAERGKAMRPPPAAP